MKSCRCCGRLARLIGVYCIKCMQIFKRAKARDKQTQAYYRALAFGSGDLWRFK